MNNEEKERPMKTVAREPEREMSVNEGGGRRGVSGFESWLTRGLACDLRC